MKIRSIRTVNGPNVFHHKPVLVMDLLLEELTEISSAELPGFTERLLSYLPGLTEHRCSPGKPGGFIERLKQGTYFAHIVEHIALELSKSTEIEVGFGKSIYGGALGHYQVIIRFRCEEGMKALLKVSVELAEALSRENCSYPLENKMEEVKGIINANKLGPSTQVILSAADKRNIPWCRLNELSLIQLGYGKFRKLIQATTSSSTSDIAVDIAQDKSLTKRMLEAAAIPVPKGIVAKTEEEALMAMEQLGLPLALKPLDSNHGNGVSLNLQTENEVRGAFREALRYSEAALLEQSLSGKDYRILVVGGKMVAASERIPAHVVGNGANTIESLIEHENRNPLRGNGHEKPMTKITLDDGIHQFLRRNGYGVKDVPAEGNKIYLRETANISTGGSATDATDIVHPEVRLLAERAARIIGLDICGIDYISHDISLPITQQSGGVIEVNAGPGIRMHHYPSHGKSRDVGAAIIDMMYPDHFNGRIPIASITGTNGKTTVTRLLSHIISRTGKVVGTTTTDGIFVDGKQVASGDTTGPISARAVLSDSEVEVAVLETARGGLVRRGLGYDWSDVGVITNVQIDHIGQDGIEDKEDIFRIKSLVAERVREGGTVVLNADDERLLKLADKILREESERNVVLFSVESDSIAISRHRREGGQAYYLKGGWLYEADGSEEIRIVRASDVPLTFSGTAGFQIANALAAIASARSLGVGIKEIRDGLMTFQANSHNSGRANFYKVGCGYLMIDYAHNPEALRAICSMASCWNGRTVTGVIALPGDRSNELLREAARAAAEGFDQLVVREDEDLRGRVPGEISQMIRDEIWEINPGLPCEIIKDSKEALSHAVDKMEPGEIVVYFYEKMEPVREFLQKRKATPVYNIDELRLRDKEALMEVG